MEYRIHFHFITIVNELIEHHNAYHPKGYKEMLVQAQCWYLPTMKVSNWCLSNPGYSLPCQQPSEHYKRAGLTCTGYCS